MSTSPELMEICASLGITTSAYYKRLKRWGDPELAAKAGRYRMVFPPVRTPVAKKPKPRKMVDQDYAKHRFTHPLTDEQKQVAAVMRGWK